MACLGGSLHLRLLARLQGLVLSELHAYLSGVPAESPVHHGNVPRGALPDRSPTRTCADRREQEHEAVRVSVTVLTPFICCQVALWGGLSGCRRLSAGVLAKPRI